MLILNQNYQSEFSFDCHDNYGTCNLEELEACTDEKASLCEKLKNNGKLQSFCGSEFGKKKCQKSCGKCSDGIMRFYYFAYWT